jgi:hypothetical protein
MANQGSRSMNRPLLLSGLWLATSAIIGCGSATEPSLPASSAPPAPSQSDEVVIEPSGDVFKVKFPKKPKPKIVETADLPDGGKMVATSYQLEHPTNKTAFVFSYSEFPKETLAAIGNVDEALDNAIDGMLGPYNGKLINKQAIKKGDSPGRKIVFEAPAKPGIPRPQKGDGQLYLIGNRLYQIYAIGPVNSYPNLTVDDFIKSFEVKAPN